MALNNTFSTQDLQNMAALLQAAQQGNLFGTQGGTIQQVQAPVFDSQTHVLQPFQNQNGETKSFVLKISYDDLNLRNTIKENHGRWLNKYKVWIFSNKHKEDLINLGCTWSDTPFQKETDISLLSSLNNIHYSNYIKKDNTVSKSFVITDFSANQSKTLALIGTYQPYANGFLIPKSKINILNQLNCINDDDNLVLI